MTTTPTRTLSESLDRMGHTLAAALSQSSAPLSHDVSERLRVARAQAMAARKTEIATPAAAWAQGGTLVLNGPGNTGRRFWHGLISAVPLLALVLGLALMQWHDGQKTVSELAELDSALLLDDLPPAAYSDPGFIEFLRQTAATSSHSSPD